ncbi:MAG: 50S ribosomal protein L10 [Firmicutes bacterium ADurb.Bin456]|nr:MAG: 50S ribosomal protein L10 [Firmicutes bacterium ADurb.Bin456]
MFALRDPGPAFYNPHLKGGVLRKVPISRSEKETIIVDLKQKFEDSKVAIFAGYKGLNVSEATRLRRRMKEAGCEFKVAKNTLTNLVVKQLNLDQLSPYLEGPVGIAFGQDPVAPAKILSEFIRETKKMEIKAGVLDGQVINAEGVKSLADLPSREVLLAMVLGGMQAPLYGFAGVLQGTLRSFVYALEAVRKQRAGEPQTT